MIHPRHYLAQRFHRQFAFEPHLIMSNTQTLTEIAQEGFTIVFVPNMATADLIKQRLCTVPVEMIDPRAAEVALRRWVRTTNDMRNGVLICHQANSSGWRAYADRIVWIGVHYDKATMNFAQAGGRIRGKYVEPIILSADQI